MMWQLHGALLQLSSPELCIRIRTSWFQEAVPGSDAYVAALQRAGGGVAEAWGATRLAPRVATVCAIHQLATRSSDSCAGKGLLANFPRLTDRQGSEIAMLWLPIAVAHRAEMLGTNSAHGACC